MSRGRDAADAACLPKICRLNFLKFLACLGPKIGYRQIVEGFGNANFLKIRLFLDSRSLTTDVTSVFCFDFDLLGRSIRYLQFGDCRRTLFNIRPL